MAKFDVVVINIGAGGPERPAARIPVTDIHFAQAPMKSEDNRTPLETYLKAIDEAANRCHQLPIQGPENRITIGNIEGLIVLVSLRNPPK